MMESLLIFIKDGILQPVVTVEPIFPVLQLTPAQVMGGYGIKSWYALQDMEFTSFIQPEYMVSEF